MFGTRTYQYRGEAGFWTFLGGAGPCQGGSRGALLLLVSMSGWLRRMFVCHACCSAGPVRSQFLVDGEEQGPSSWTIRNMWVEEGE